MFDLKLFILGSPRIECNGALVEIKRRKALALLIYLAIAGQHQRRDTMATLLWPESTQASARQALRRDLSELHLALGGRWIDANRESVGLRPGFWLDVAQFQRHLDERAATPAGCPQHLADAVALYRDDFLTGFTLADSPPFDEWQSFQTETLRQACGSALERLAQLLAAQGDPEAAIPHIRRRLTLDPLHEPAHRQLMQLYAQADQQVDALRQYERCCRLLNDELGVTPVSETTLLYDQIREHKMEPATRRPLAPPPAVARLHRHNLPTQTTPFVGREQELADIQCLLLGEPGCRLLNLFGPGGIGKTRLALAAATQTLDAFADGVFFVSLAPVSEVAFIVPAIAEALRFTFYGQSDPKTQLLDYLSQKGLLLIVDNLEHLYSGADLLADIVNHAPGVTLLTTSRERLHLQEEWVYEVQGLPFPAPGEAMANVDGYPSVRLFLQRARQSQATFAPMSGDLTEIGRICQLVEGMPLGLELAAPWIRTLSCREIAAEIERSLDFLTTPLRNAPERHLSLRVVFEQTWGRLSQAEQAGLMALSVFCGGCTREAAEAGAGATLPVLGSLVDKALLHRTNLGRYELHELIRRFADEKLRESGEDREMRRRHALAYLALAQAAEPHLHAHQQKQWLDRLEQDHDNFRAALRWSQNTKDDSGLGLQLAVALWQFWWMRGHQIEGRKSMDAMLQTTNSSSPPAIRAWALLGAGILGMNHYDHGYVAYRQTLMQHLEEALTLFNTIGDDAGMALSLCYLGTIMDDLADLARDSARALSLLQEGLAVSYGQSTHPWITAHILNRLAITLWRANLTQATSLCEESLALARHLGDAQAIAVSLNRLANITGDQLDFVQAAKLAEEALHVARETGDMSNVISALSHLADELRFMGEFDRATALIEEMHGLSLEHGLRQAGWALTMFGLIARDQGDYVRAISRFKESINWYRNRLDTWGNWWNVLGIATVASAQGRHRRAARIYGAVDAWQTSINLLRFPRNQHQFGTYMDATRAQLGDAAYDGIFEEGRAMTTEQAFQYALAND